MAENKTVVDVEPRKVFDIFLNPPMYPAWVAGPKRFVQADPEWPAPGSAFYFKLFGGAREDKTELLEIDEPRRLVLKAHVRPFGISRVVLELEPRGSGTQITMIETLEWPSGPAAVRRIADAIFYLRNIEALRRLKRIAEAR